MSHKTRCFLVRRSIRKGVDLLCLLPTRFRRFTHDQKPTESAVEKPNMILFLFIENHMLATKEPNYSSSDWTNVISLVREVA